MKLRQKLAVVLASAMVVTAVPVVTMAAVPTVSKEYIGAKDDTLPSTSYVRFKTGGDIYAGEQFWVALENAELDGYKADGTGTTTTGTITVGSATVNYHWTKKNEVGFTFVGAAGTQVLAEDETFEFNLGGVKLKGGDAYFVIDPNNTAIVGTSGAEKKNEVKVLIGTTQAKKGAVTIGTLPNIFEEGQLADIVITEPYAGAIVAGADDDGKLKVEVTLENPDFEFVSRGSMVSVKGERGFINEDLEISNYTVEKYGDKVSFEIDVTDLAGLTSGKIVISGLTVMSNTKNPTEGDLKVTIGGEINKLEDAVVAKVVAADTKITMKDDKVVEIIAGRDKEIEFKHAENVEDGINPNHTIEYTIDNGYFGTYTAKTVSGTVVRPELKNATREDKINAFEEVCGEGLPTGVTVVDVTMDGSKFVGFSVKVDAASVSSTEKDDFTYKMPLFVDLNTADATEVKVTASGERAIDEEVSTVAAKVKAPITVTYDVMPVKVGLQKQAYTGKITITETDKGMLQRGDLVLRTAADGYKFTGKGEVKVTSGNVVIDEAKVDKTSGEITIPVKYVSKEASTIEITGFVVDVDRTVPEGTFSLDVDGTTLGTDAKVEAHGKVELKDFFKVTTPNTEDIKNGALKAVTASFTVGSKEYTVDGATKTMDAEAYVQNDRTMVPVRYLSEAFGIAPENVLFSNGVVTVIAGEKVVQLKVNSNELIMNGTTITMDAKAEVKEGRTYVPMKFIAAALGVTSSWDSATKTATFSNKN